MPFDFEDALEAKRVFEDIEWFGLSRSKSMPVGVIRALIRESEQPIRELGFFSAVYCTARNYALDKGGETLTSLLGAIEEFELFARDPKLREAHVHELEAQYLWTPNVVREWVARCRSQTWLDGALERLLAIQSKYQWIREAHRPVVYAVAVEPDWFDRPLDDLAINARALRPIGPECIFAKVILPRDAEFVLPFANSAEFQDCR